MPVGHAFIARTGGDEFVIVQSGSPQPESAQALARRIVHHFEEVFDDERSDLGVSIGIAVYPKNGDTKEANTQKC
jgi:GGDEF domain-containing protein